MIGRATALCGHHAWSYGIGRRAAFAEKRAFSGLHAAFKHLSAPALHIFLHFRKPDIRRFMLSNSANSGRIANPLEGMVSRPRHTASVSLKHRV